MKKKRKIHSLLMNIFSTIIGIILINVFFVGNAVNNLALSQNVLSIYEETHYDYIVRNLSESQIVEFEASVYADKVVPYYEIQVTPKITNSPVTLISTREKEDYSFTEFTDERIISMSDNLLNNAIYIDYTYAKQNKLKLNDEIQLANSSSVYVITRIYKSYKSDIAYAPGLIEVLRDKGITDLPIAGAYVKTNNPTAFYSEKLENYKPYGRMKSIEDFDSQEQYDAYVEDFNNRTYSGEIHNKNVGYNAAKERYESLSASYKIDFLWAGVTMALFLSGLNIVVYIIFNKKKIDNEILQGGREQVKKSTYLTHFIQLFTSFVAILLSVLTVWLNNNSFNYVGFGLVFANSLVTIGIAAGGIIISQLIFILLLRPRITKGN